MTLYFIQNTTAFDATSSTSTEHKKGNFATAHDAGTHVELIDCCSFLPYAPSVVTYIVAREPPRAHILEHFRQCREKGTGTDIDRERKNTHTHLCKPSRRVLAFVKNHSPQKRCSRSTNRSYPRNAMQAESEMIRRASRCIFLVLLILDHEIDRNLRLRSSTLIHLRHRLFPPQVMTLLLLRRPRSVRIARDRRRR